ncbi:MAG: tetratricopeptide repeat protein [Roseivirga sp.]|nr:tetratricopeptide repeat protein [Roseivirga sp.]
MPNVKKHFPLLVILLVAFIVYWPVTNGEYIAGWDDDQQILNNEDVKNLSWQSIKNYFTTYYVASYQPLASLSFGIEYSLFGENAFVHHFTNLLLHLLNVVLLSWLMTRLFPEKRLLVLFVTAIFAFHPLQTEVVGWISTRSTLMYSGFFFLSCISYISYLTKDTGKTKNLIFCAFFFILSLFTKSASVTLPIVLLLLDYYYKRGFSWRLILEKIPLFMGSVAIGLASIDSRKVVDSIGSFSDYYSFFEKVGLSSYTLVLYFWKSIAPSKLMTYYGYPMKLEEGEGLGMLYMLSPLGLALLLLALWWVYKKSSPKFRRQWVLGLAFFAVNIGLVINFTPFGPTMWAERYMYLPILGIFICLGLLLYELSKMAIMKNAVYSVVVLALLFFAYQSRAQSYIWEGRVSLWTNAIQHTNAVYPWMELGNEYQRLGDIDKAIEFYNGGVSLNPFYTKVYYYRGMAIKTKGDKAYAKIDFERVIKSGGDKKAEAFYERGLLYEDLNMMDSALVDYDSAIYYDEVSPAIFRKNYLTGASGSGGSNQGVLVQRVMGMLSKSDSLMKAGNLPEALQILDGVLLINPQMERALVTKGLILSNQGDFQTALGVFDQAIEINGKNQQSRLSRAFALSQTRDFQKSIEDYSYVVDSIGTTDGEVFYFRAIAYLNNRQKQEACTDLDKSVSLGYAAANQLKAQQCN